MKAAVRYEDFRGRIENIFDNIRNSDSVSYQLIDLTDLFQKIAAIYAFAKDNHESSFHNPIIFQVVESALFYGVCVQIRRLADGSQRNEISLFKILQEVKANSGGWTREEFVTWDGSAYDASNLRREHEAEVSEILAANYKNGISSAWIPLGKHEVTERRHEIFDLLSNSKANERSPSDVWGSRIASYLIEILEHSAKNVVHFSNVHLAHRIARPPGRNPEFNISLKEIESCVCGLWKCFNVLNSILNDSYTSPEVTHQYDLFEFLGLALVTADHETGFISQYDLLKDRMENEVSAFARIWGRTFL
jgi:DNA-binding ferritin-like protein (Dps family)